MNKLTRIIIVSVLIIAAEVPTVYYFSNAPVVVFFIAFLLGQFTNAFLDARNFSEPS